MRNRWHWFLCCSLILVFFFFFWKIHPCGGGNKFCFHFSLFIHKPMINNHINCIHVIFITPPESSSLIQLIVCLIIINNKTNIFIFIFTIRNQIEMNYEITRIYKILQTNNLFVFDCCFYSPLFHLLICLNWEMNEWELNNQSNQMIDWWKSYILFCLRLIMKFKQVHHSLWYSFHFIQSLWWIRIISFDLKNENETKKNEIQSFRQIQPFFTTFK